MSDPHDDLRYVVVYTKRSWPGCGYRAAEVFETADKAAAFADGLKPLYGGPSIYAIGRRMRLTTRPEPASVPCLGEIEEADDAK